jgi:alkanesulfonate monooxygenase
VQQPHIPINVGGSSDGAIEAAAKHADVYALFGETLDQVREQVARVRAAATRHGRQIKFSLSLRPILADTEAAAWQRAEEILARVKTVRQGGKLFSLGTQKSVGSLRLLEAAERGDRHDKRLWTAVARETGAAGNSTSLVGTVDQVADALQDYYDIGITTFLIRGFDPLEDAVAYGDLIARTNALVAARDAAQVAAE